MTPEQMGARIAFLENAMRVVVEQRNAAFDHIIDLTVQRDLSNHEVGRLAERLKALEDKLKTE